MTTPSGRTVAPARLSVRVTDHDGGLLLAVTATAPSAWALSRLLPRLGDVIDSELEVKEAERVRT